VVTSRPVEPTGVDVERASELFAALVDPARLRILSVLADAARCVCDIRSAVPIAENLLSYHLRVLREVGLIEGSRRGRWIEYRVSDVAAGLIAGAVGAAGLAATVNPPRASLSSASRAMPSCDGHPMHVSSVGSGCASSRARAGRPTKSVVAP
jgi:ArsR family transcriptional regulator